MPNFIPKKQLFNSQSFVHQLNDISSLATAHNTAMAHILYIKTKCQFTLTSQFGTNNYESIGGLVTALNWLLNSKLKLIFFIVTEINELEWLKTGKKKQKSHYSEYVNSNEVYCFFHVAVPVQYVGGQAYKLFSWSDLATTAACQDSELA